MKLQDLFELKQPKIPKRPKKDLVFQSDTAWKVDIALLHGNHIFATTQHGKLYAVDPNKRIVYGIYDDSKDSGVVYYQPRHVTPGIKLESKEYDCSRWNIMEMFGTKIPLQWKTYAFRGRTRNSATFEIDNEKYNLTTDLYSIILPSQQNKSLEAIEVSFRRILETGVPTVTQTAPKHPAKVFGIIYNEIQEAITTQAPDIIFFSAKYINDGGNLVIFKKRLRIYQELYDRILQHGYPGLPEPIENKNGVHFVLFNSNLKITKQDIAWIKNNI